MRLRYAGVGALVIAMSASSSASADCRPVEEYLNGAESSAAAMACSEWFDTALALSVGISSLDDADKLRESLVENAAIVAETSFADELEALASTIDRLAEAAVENDETALERALLQLSVARLNVACGAHGHFPITLADPEETPPAEGTAVPNSTR